MVMRTVAARTPKTKKRKKKKKKKKKKKSSTCRRCHAAACSGWALNLIGLLVGMIIVFVVDHSGALPGEERHWSTLPMAASIVNVERRAGGRLRVGAWAARNSALGATRFGGGADGVAYDDPQEKNVDERTAGLARKFGLHTALAERAMSDARRGALLGVEGELRALDEVGACTVAPNPDVVARAREVLSTAASPHGATVGGAQYGEGRQAALELVARILGNAHAFTAKQLAAISEFCHGKHTRRNAVINLLGRGTEFGKRSLQEMNNGELKQYARWHTMERLERFLLLFELVLGERAERTAAAPHGNAARGAAGDNDGAPPSRELNGTDATDAQREPTCVRCVDAFDSGAVAAFARLRAARARAARRGIGAVVGGSAAGGAAGARVVAAIARIDALKLSAARASRAASGVGVQVRCILCTVTYYANRAHNLTRSP